MSVSSEMKSEKNLESITIPYVLSERILMSPGIWNGYYYDKSTIEKAFKNTEWTPQNRALFLDHIDDRASEWIGEVNNLKMKDGHLVGDIIIVDKDVAMKLAYGAKFGISPKIIGDADYNRRITDFRFENFSVVLNPAVKTTFLNAEIKNKGDKTMPEEMIEEASEVKLEQTLGEIVKSLNEIKGELSKQKADIEELKKKKYPYPEEEECKEDKKKKYPYPEMEEVVSAMLETIPNVEWRDFVAKYIKEHKDEAPVTELMKRAAEEYKKISNSDVQVVDLDKKLGEIIEQKFSEVGIKPTGVRVAQKYIDPTSNVDAFELDGAMFEMMRGALQ